MPNKKTKSTKRRTQVKELAKKNKKLSSAELKKVKGGSVTDLIIDPFTSAKANAVETATKREQFAFDLQKA